MADFSRRDLISAALAITALGRSQPASAQDVEAVRASLMATLANLTWDRRRAEQIWTQPGGPQFEIIDYVDMLVEGSIRRQPLPEGTPASEVGARGVKLSYRQVAEVREVLVAVSLHYRRLGLRAPKLPMADGKFYVFVVGDLGDIAGATGSAVGIDPSYGTTAAILLEGLTIVPRGTHLMLNAVGYFEPFPEHPFSSRITIAHELLHAIDEYMVESTVKAGVLDGVGNWWSEGNVDAAAQYTLGALGYRPEVVLIHGRRGHAKNIGMRPFDYPLTLKGVPDRLPDWVKAGNPSSSQGWLASLFRSEPTEAERAKLFFKSNATYFTACFWRFLMKEEAPVGMRVGGAAEPGNFELLPVLREVVLSSADVTRANQNSQWMDPGVSALDSFLRTNHPTWGATGLHRAFPAFIAHWVEWPDQVLKSRYGLLAHPQWIDAMFMDGAPKLEISPTKDISIELDVLPLAAKAIRFEIPQVGPTPQDYPPVTITVSIVDGHGQARAIDNIHVGLRGQCLANGFSQPRPTGQNRVRRWASVKATPLKRRTVNDETILSFINVATDPTTTRPVRIRVQVSLQVASTTGQVSYHPPPVETSNGTVAPPPSRSPPVPDDTPLVPIQIETEEIRVVMIKDADLVRMLNDALDINAASAIDRESDEGPANRQSAAANVMGAMTGANFRPGAGRGGDLAAALAGRTMTRPFEIALTIPKVELGYVGSVSGGNVVAAWHEPAYARFAEYGVSTSVQIETDAVQVQITSSGDGAILGTFSADFDRGSQNVEAIFRGRIEGRFSLGIANDEEAGDQQLPEDPSACVPTDFFIGAGRAGMNTQEMGEFFRQQAAEMQASASSGPPSTSSRGDADTSGQTGFLQQGDCRVTPAEFDAWFQEIYGSQPMFTPAQRTELRNQFLSAWEFTEQMICASRNIP